jgi:hypothetical protein
MCMYVYITNNPHSNYQYKHTLTHTCICIQPNAHTHSHIYIYINTNATHLRGERVPHVDTEQRKPLDFLGVLRLVLADVGGTRGVHSTVPPNQSAVASCGDELGGDFFGFEQLAALGDLCEFVFVCVCVCVCVCVVKCRA